MGPLCVLGLLSLYTMGIGAQTFDADLIVYGATPGGIQESFLCQFLTHSMQHACRQIGA